MLSIIISSYNENYFNQLENNIKETIGQDILYEIIKIENHNKYSINQAYNLGANKSSYQSLLFIHEDLLFLTKDWGEKLLELLLKEDIGCIGLAGENYESYFPSYWYSNPDKKAHIIQEIDNGEIFMNKVNFRKDRKIEEIVSIDGVFIACKKEVFEKNKFDESLKGFHGYDYDFSVRISRKYQNYVTSEILIKHYSSGSFTNDWLENVLKVRKKNGFYPKFQKINKDLELQKAYNLILLFNRFNYSKLKSFKILINYINPQAIGFKNCFKILNRVRYL